MQYNLISYKSECFDRQCWTVFDYDTCLTPLYAMIYSSLRLNKRASSTQHRHMTAICQFYEYIQRKHNESFDFFFERLGMRGVISELDGFSSYLDVGQKGGNIVSFGSGANAIAVSTSRLRISDVFQFLRYLNNRYTTTKYNNTFVPKYIGHEQTKISFLLRDKQQDLTASGSKRSAAAIQEEYKSLTPFQCAAFLKIIRPTTPAKPNKLNPFSSLSVSFRNYLICTLALEYGLRRGEINLLETDSFKPSLHNLNGVTSYYITVTNCDDEENVEGSIKTETSHRTLKITKVHYNYLCFYVNNLRLRLIEEHEDCDSSILFLSTQSPKPLCLRMLNKIFESLTEALHQHFPDIADLKSMEYMASCHPHKLRHTWAVSQLYHLVDEQKMSITDAKDLLRVNGGWSIKSEMPDHYGRRFLADKANAANLRHVLQGEEQC
ncbi:MAG: integrase [Moritella dasanensis]|jgi:integrase